MFSILFAIQMLGRVYFFAVRSRSLCVHHHTTFRCTLFFWVDKLWMLLYFGNVNVRQSTVKTANLMNQYGYFNFRVCRTSQKPETHAIENCNKKTVLLNILRYFSSNDKQTICFYATVTAPTIARVFPVAFSVCVCATSESCFHEHFF